MAITDNGITRHQGAVLALGEIIRNNYTDYIAAVWDDEIRRVTRVDYASTRYHNGVVAEVDATPAAREMANIYIYHETLHSFDAFNARQATTPQIGNRVEVYKGRTGMGCIGTLFFIGKEQRYGSKIVRKVGIGLDNTVVRVSEHQEVVNYDRVVWTYLSNIRVLKPDENLLPVETGDIRARNLQDKFLEFINP